MSEQPDTCTTLLRVSDVAALAKVSTKTVRRWISANELAIVRLGRSIRIPQAELARFIAARSSKN